MELKTNLTEETVQNRICEVGINPNYWYAVAWSEHYQQYQNQKQQDNGKNPTLANSKLSVDSLYTKTPTEDVTD